MMYPRLYLARDLLRDDGVIFISIDDNEVRSLLGAVFEIFGEDNFVGNAVWQKKYGPANDALGVSATHEYVVIMAKNIEKWNPGLLGRTDEQLNAFKNPDNDQRGPWRASDLSARTFSQSGHYTIIGPTGKEFLPPPSRAWIINKTKYGELLADNRITFGVDGNGRPMQKKFLSDVKDGITPDTWWDRNKAGDNKIARYEIKSIFPDNIYDTPKPTKLIALAMNVAGINSEDIILDFFAGSGTTAHAVLDLNKQDGGNRKFILVQLPEPTDRTDYPTIAEITKERVRRVIKKQNDEDGNEKNQDRGFRVFNLAESNFTPWDGSIDQSPEALSRQMEMHIEHVRQGRTDEDILFEILLKSGFPLSIPVQTLQLDGKTVYSIHDGLMLVCLERNLTMPLVQAIVDRLPERVVFLDEGFAGNDALKVNAKEACKLKNIIFKVV